jgi:acetylornithine deacetylase/succinyl-diaminopimelate desuccinylase-like protein
MQSIVGKTALAVFVSALCMGSVIAQEKTSKPAADIDRIMQSASFKVAADALQKDHDQWVKDIITITEIPAPPFKESKRAEAFMQMLKDVGLTDVEIDKEGNAFGVRKGTGDGPLVVVAAHLDTVFPEGTEVKVRRDGTRLYAPGVGDDSSGLATLLSVVRAMNTADIKTKGDIVFMGNVGEEGLGNLRGVRYFFQEGKYKDKVDYFFSLDGGMTELTNCAVGSKRYTVTYNGPGGHSYSAYGIVNPMAAMAQTVVDFYKIETPKDPKTTYSASVTGGGTSPNSIPDSVWLQVDMRSVNPDELNKLDKQFLQIVENAVAAENKARSTKNGEISADVKEVGDRPAGRTPDDAEITVLTTAAFKANGIETVNRCASTDSNLPISLGIPAVTIPRVAQSERAHSLDEWIDIAPEDNLKVKKGVLTTILGTARAE